MDSLSRARELSNARLEIYWMLGFEVHVKLSIHFQFEAMGAIASIKNLPVLIVPNHGEWPNFPH